MMKIAHVIVTHTEFKEVLKVETPSIYVPDFMI